MREREREIVYRFGGRAGLMSENGNSGLTESE